MIVRSYKTGNKLDVAGLNQITVLIDRSETELSEIGLNSWRSKLKGPPHEHDGKEQVFYITSGEGIINVGDEKFKVKPGMMIYIPSSVIHSTIVTGTEPLEYFLFNSFLDQNKEGDKSFFEHIEKVKSIRKKQADSGIAISEKIEGTALKKGKLIENVNEGKKYYFGSNTTILLIDRAETKRVEVTLVSWPAGNRGALVAHKEKEQTFFVLSGCGEVTINKETKNVEPGDVIFVPRNTPHTTHTSAEELTYLCFNTIIAEERDRSFDEMYQRVAPGRITRWKLRQREVGE